MKFRSVIRRISFFCLIAIATVCSRETFSQMLGVWNITYPTENPKVTFQSNVSASGNAPYNNAPYLVNIVNDNGSQNYGSASGVSTGTSWACTVLEPGSGWTPAPSATSIDAILELRINGVRQAHVSISIQ